LRQAGRYLPEYREVRAGVKDFLDLCYTPEKAAEVTLQPIRRFNMDAAILFSDILVIPHALGQEVAFMKGEGPKLPPLQDAKAVAALHYQPEVLAPVMETVSILARELPADKTLIGFSGAPWTLACYMLQGGGSKDFAQARAFAHQQPAAFAPLLQKLEHSITDYLTAQVEAGAEVAMLFDSWAGVLSAQEFDDWVIAPTQRIIAALRAKFPELPVIGFPRLAGIGYRRYVKQTGVTAVHLDSQILPEWAISHVSDQAVIQGNLDPLLLATDKQATVAQARRLKEAYKDVPHIFNLGHGFLPWTPVEHVEALVEELGS
jgi:uroporphyrinogen decarboxylase